MARLRFPVCCYLPTWIGSHVHLDTLTLLTLPTNIEPPLTITSHHQKQCPQCPQALLPALAHTHSRTVCVCVCVSTPHPHPHLTSLPSTCQPHPLPYHATRHILTPSQYLTACGSAADAGGGGTQKRWATYALAAAIPTRSTAVTSPARVHAVGETITASNTRVQEEAFLFFSSSLQSN